MWLVRVISRNKGLLIACGIAAWVGIEAGGKGTGVLRWLFSPSVTREGGFHPVDLVGARPKGPVRLTAEAAAAVDARLAKAFAGNVPHHQRTSRMGHLYQMKDGEVAYMDPFFGAVLAAMHPDTEHLLWLDVTGIAGSARGAYIPVAVFLGPDEKVKFAFNLRGIKRDDNVTGFKAHASDTSGWRDLPAREAAGEVLIVDDPGPLKTPEGMSSYIQIRGVKKTEDVIIAAVLNEGNILVRHKFFSAVLGKPVQGVDASAPGPAHVVDFEPRQEGFHPMSGVILRKALIDSLGPARAATARFSKVTVTGGRGSFYGLTIEGSRYLAVGVTDYLYGGYQFFWDGSDGLKPVASVTKVDQKDKAGDAGSGPYHLIPVAEAGSAERLIVFRSGQRGAPIAGMWPLQKWLAAMERLVEADPKALPDAGIDMEAVRRAAGDRWLARCARFLSAYPSFEVKTYSDEWKRGECVRLIRSPRQ